MKVNMRTSSSRSSNIKATASSQSAGSKRAAKVKSKRAKMEMERVVAVADERVFPSSHSQARADSNPTQFSYDYDDGSADASAAMVASPELRYLHAPQCQGSVFQYCSANVKYDVQSHNLRIPSPCRHLFN